MPNIRMVTLKNILDKKLETLGVTNPDMSDKISKLTIETELNDAREYHISQYELCKKYNIYRENAKHLKEVFNNYCDDPDKRDFYDFNIKLQGMKICELFVLGVYLFSSSDDDY